MKQENSEIGKKVLTDGLDHATARDFMVAQEYIMNIKSEPNFYRSDQ